jgi:hypothetical protein
MAVRGGGRTRPASGGRGELVDEECRYHAWVQGPPAFPWKPHGWCRRSIRVADASVRSRHRRPTHFLPDLGKSWARIEATPRTPEPPLALSTCGFASLRGLDLNQRPLGYETGGLVWPSVWCRFVPSFSGFVPSYAAPYGRAPRGSFANGLHQGKHSGEHSRMTSALAARRLAPNGATGRVSKTFAR